MARKLRALGLLLVIAAVPSGCNKGSSEGEVQNSTSSSSEDGPADYLITGAAVQAVMNSCERKELANSMWMTYSGAINEASNNAKINEFHKTITDILSIKDMQNSPISDPNPGNPPKSALRYTGPNVFVSEAILETENPPMVPYIHIYGCPYTVSAARIVDRTSTGPKDMNIMWEADFKENSILSAIRSLPSTSLADRGTGFPDGIKTYQFPQGQRGTIHFHKTDLYGWEAAQQGM